jgi:putative endonuclease
MVGKEAYIAVYMMASGVRGTLYIGVTSRFCNRIYEHREGLIPGFTKRYGCTRLVWYEPQESMIWAIHREKALKRYLREWKINLIERQNPHWDDLFPSVCGMPLGPRDKPEGDGFI